MSTQLDTGRRLLQGEDGMKIPESVKINGVSHTVTIEPDSELNPSLSGAISHWKQTITLTNGALPWVKKTFLHECVHGMLYALGNGHDEHDEKQVDGMASQLLRLIEDNPEMFKE
jgi:hypothetical protein